ncbi:MAG: hypothetical protein WD045_14250 [Pirellulaceae bacterium]
MASSTASKADRQIARDLSRETKISLYDQVAGMLVSLLVLVGLGVGILFLIFLTTRSWKRNIAIPVIIEEAAGRGDHAFGTARDLEAPGLEELEDILEPQMETSFEAITDAITSNEAALNAVDGNAEASGGGGGLGDSRPPGPLGEGADIIPRYERWQIQYTATEMQTYARQLDFFKIELGVAGAGSTEIEYAVGFGKGGSATRKGPLDGEERLYMIWKSGALKEADQDLLGSAGISTQGRIMMQFYPDETENLLAYVESEYMKANNTALTEVKQTVFGVRPQGREYEFFVINQTKR